MGVAQPSSWIYWPTKEKPHNRYKYVSIELNLNTAVVYHTRTSYALLDFLGDLGGLFGIFLEVGRFIVAPISSYALKSSLMTSIYRYKSDRNTSTRDVLLA